MAVHLLQVTLGGGARTQFTSTPIFARQAIIQNNAANDMRVGDSTTSTTKGAKLSSGTSLNSGPMLLQHIELSEWYVAGTAADVLDILYLD